MWGARRASTCRHQSDGILSSLSGCVATKGMGFYLVFQALSPLKGWDFSQQLVARALPRPHKSCAFEVVLQRSIECAWCNVLFAISDFIQSVISCRYLHNIYADFSYNKAAIIFRASERRSGSKGGFTARRKERWFLLIELNDCILLIEL